MVAKNSSRVHRPLLVWPRWSTKLGWCLHSREGAEK